MTDGGNLGVEIGETISQITNLRGEPSSAEWDEEL